MVGYRSSQGNGRIQKFPRERPDTEVPKGTVGYRSYQGNGHVLCAKDFFPLSMILILEFRTVVFFVFEFISLVNNNNSENTMLLYVTLLQVIVVILQ